MHLSVLLAFGLRTAAAVTSTNPVQKRDVLADLQNQAIAALQNATHNGVVEKSCNTSTAIVRKEW